MSATTMILILALLGLAVYLAFRLGQASRPTFVAPPSAEPPSKPATQPTAQNLPRQSQPKAVPAPSRPTTSAPPKIASWGYQLQKFKAADATASHFDLLVIDPTKDGDDANIFSRAEIERLKTKPDGGRRRVLAYLSIGEAESYRGYWDKSWKKAPPAWLLDENPEWEENYAVCYWNPQWQALMCGSKTASLDRILAAGFDGVYLDKCDVYDDMRARKLEAARSRKDLESDMIAFIAHLSAYAKKADPGFLVIMQNAEDLLPRADLRRVVDGIGKEELVFGIDAPEKRNSAEDFDHSRDMLDLLAKEGKLVMVVEYLSAPQKIADARGIVDALGYTLFISPKNRELDKLNIAANLPGDGPLVS